MCASYLILNKLSSARWPLRLRSAISPSSASGLTTRPLPMTQALPGWSAPAGTSRSTNFLPPTTSVCAALLPPPKRTTTSASAASISTILPLPSSPHCVPTTATVFMSFPRAASISPISARTRRPEMQKLAAREINSELEQRRRGDRGNRLELVEDGARHRFVHFENAERGSAHAIAAEFQSPYIYSGLPEHRAHRADHPGNVAIVQHQKIAFGHRLDAVTVDLCQAQRAISEHCA